MTRVYNNGVASLGFPGGPSVVFRLNPNDVQWNFTVNTSVTETVGGRVVQVLGATLSDLTVYGSYGERRGGGKHVQSRTYAESFLAKMKEMAAYQARQATVHRKMHEPAVFTFAPKGWKFAVYIKDLSDPDGGGVTHRPGKFSYDYVLTLMIHEDISNTAKILGTSNGDLTRAKDKAVASYIARIANGVGWHASDFNGGNPGEAAEATGTGAAAPSANRGTTATRPPAVDPVTGQRRGGGPVE